MKNNSLFKKAKRNLVGGVDSPVRSFKYVGGDPLLIKKGKGSRVFDYSGKPYIDYVLSYGASILGHANPGVVKSVKLALEEGFSFGTTNSREIELASLIQKAAPLIEKVRFVNSGTEGVLGATQLARHYTGKDKILSFKDSYHGHAGYLLEEACDYGDKRAIEKIFKKHENEIAGVIVEPVGGNHGVVLPDIDFLRQLRRLTKKYGSLLIFDEVITGFRFRFGLSSDPLGVKPDLVCLGKIIGGGLPIGAYGGRAFIMDNLAPIGGLYQGSTFAGNPIVMQSGISTLKALSSLKNKYKSLEEKVKNLADAIDKEREKHNINLQLTRYKTMFSVRFQKRAQFQSFYRSLVRRGIYFAPSENEANFLSFSHTKKDIDKTIGVIKEVLGEM